MKLSISSHHQAQSKSVLRKLSQLTRYNLILMAIVFYRHDSMMSYKRALLCTALVFPLEFRLCALAVSVALSMIDLFKRRK